MSIPVVFMACGTSKPRVAAPEGGGDTRIIVPAGETAAFVILWDPSSAPPRENAVWLGYLMYRVQYRIKEGRTRPPYGVQMSTFDEEVWARDAATATYLELREKDPELDARYFSDLSQVREAGFLREYVWTFLNQGRWDTEPTGLRGEEFETWRRVHLADHRVETHGQIALEPR